MKLIRDLEHRLQERTNAPSDRSFVASRIRFDRIVAVVEQMEGESFAAFRDCHGDWGRGMVLDLAWRRCGLTLSQLGELAGGMAYKTVFAQGRYTGKRLDKDARWQAVYEQCQKHFEI